MSTFHSALRVLGGLRVTLYLFGYFATSIAYYYFNKDSSEWWLATPLFLLVVNLFTATLTNPAFRQKQHLFTFHVGLMAILLLIAIGRLTYLKGEVEVTEGEQMPSQLSHYQSGLLHELKDKEIGFQLNNFNIEFDESQRKRFIRSHVQWSNKSGEVMQYTIADLQPLIQSGYRFYSTKHKGFAPVFLWQPTDGTDSQLGAIHLPAYPENEFNQSQEWNIPGTSHTVWALLQFDEKIITPGVVSKFRIPEKHTLIIRHNNQRTPLTPGEGMQFPEGRLTYKELRTWMGFVVFYDWTLPWLLAACFFSVIALAWHYWQKISATPWEEK